MWWELWVVSMWTKLTAIGGWVALGKSSPLSRPRFPHYEGLEHMVLFKSDKVIYYGCRS